MFVHLTSEDNRRSVERSGVRARSVFFLDPTHQWAELPAGVYCMPVTPDFFSTHQWVRELKRNGKRTIVAAYFRLPSSERVWFGRYNMPHELVTAATAARRVMQATDRLGLEVILPRAVGEQEIHEVRDVPQKVGWRYFPGAHERGLPCTCPACLPRGTIKAKRTRDRLDPEGLKS